MPQGKKKPKKRNLIGTHHTPEYQSPVAPHCLSSDCPVRLVNAPVYDSGACRTQACRWPTGWAYRSTVGHALA